MQSQLPCYPPGRLWHCNGCVISSARPSHYNCPAIHLVGRHTTTALLSICLVITLQLRLHRGRVWPWPFVHFPYATTAAGAGHLRLHRGWVWLGLMVTSTLLQLAAGSGQCWLRRGWTCITLSWPYRRPVKRARVRAVFPSYNISPRPSPPALSWLCRRPVKRVRGRVTDILL